MTAIKVGPVPGLLLALALGLAVAACGGGKSGGVASLNGAGQATSTTNTSSSSDPTQAGLAFARCMRQHGINMPDPKVGANERMNQQLPPGVSPDDPKFNAAQQACQKYLPNGGQPTRPNAQQLQRMLGFARCMRQHGINMPDPGPNGIDLAGSGVNSDSPKFKAAQQTCQQYLPSHSGGGR